MRCCRVDSNLMSQKKLVPRRRPLQTRIERREAELSQPPAIAAVWQRHHLPARRRGGGLGGPRRTRYQYSWASWSGIRCRRLRWAAVHRRTRQARWPRGQVHRRRPQGRVRQRLLSGAWYAELPGLLRKSRMKRCPRPWPLRGPVECNRGDSRASQESTHPRWGATGRSRDEAKD